jgi:hypothetical protein
MEIYVAKHPQKNYGRLEWGGKSPTLLATDYKSPPIVIEIRYEKQETRDIPKK